MPINHFPFVGTHFKTSWESKGMANSFGPGSSNRGGERPVGWGIQRGQRSLGGGFQRRQRCLGGRNPKEGRAFLAGRIQRNRRFRGTRLCSQSLVCYTFGDRGWRKGIVRGGNNPFPSATEQAGSASSQTRSPGVCDSRIRLFGCR